MKKLIYLVLGLSLVVFACSKDDDGGNGGSAAEGTVTAKIDGNSFTSMEMTTSAQDVNSGGVKVLRIQGSNTDGETIALMVSGFDGPGTYDIGGGSNIFSNASYVIPNISNPTNSKTYVAPFDDTVAGEVKISEKTDTKVKGTFHFTAEDQESDVQKEVTDGSFNVKFQ